MGSNHKDWSVDLTNDARPSNADKPMPNAAMLALCKTAVAEGVTWGRSL